MESGKPVKAGRGELPMAAKRAGSASAQIYPTSGVTAAIADRALSAQPWDQAEGNAFYYGERRRFISL